MSRGLRPLPPHFNHLSSHTSLYHPHYPKKWYLRCRLFCIVLFSFSYRLSSEIHLTDRLIETLKVIILFQVNKKKLFVSRVVGYIGVECSVVDGSAPVITGVRSGPVCDARGSNPCTSVSLFLIQFAFTYTFSCRFVRIISTNICINIMYNILVWHGTNADRKQKSKLKVSTVTLK